VAETVLHIRLESQRLIIRSMDRDDLDKMELWRPFTDPLCNLWNIPRSTSLGRDVWFVMHGADPTRLWFAIERVTDGQLIGTLSLREIVERISARLGISLGADYLDQGYGSEALRTFLPHYFRTLGFQRLLLDVAAANKRAVYVYAKLGFQQTGSHYRAIPEGTDLSFLHQAAYRELRPYFRRHLGRMQLLFLDMALESRDWEKTLAQIQARAQSPLREREKA
jgi:RimJ/RimL family protein N-acetyltransferase